MHINNNKNGMMKWKQMKKRQGKQIHWKEQVLTSRQKREKKIKIKQKKWTQKQEKEAHFNCQSSLITPISITFIYIEKVLFLMHVFLLLLLFFFIICRSRTSIEMEKVFFSFLIFFICLEFLFYFFYGLY